MILAIIGESGSGKSSIETRLSETGYSKIISHTTRLPRDLEVNNVDYHFVNDVKFCDLINNNELLEWECYSQNRLYGVAKKDITRYKDSVVVLTPNGYRALKKIEGDNVIGIYLKASLGTRMIRYIKRCGVGNFNFDDKNEISSRVERDYGMFLGIEKEVDIVVDSNGDVFTTFCNIMYELRKRGICKKWDYLEKQWTKLNTLLPEENVMI